jgi:hypothetical protein
MNEEQLVVEVVTAGDSTEGAGEGAPAVDQPGADSAEGGHRAQERIRELANRTKAAEAQAEAERQRAQKADERLERMLERFLSPEVTAEPEPDPDDEAAVLRHGIAKTDRKTQEIEQELAKLKFERARDHAVGGALANVSGLNQRAAERLKAHLSAVFANDPRADLRRESAAYLEDLGLLTKTKDAGQSAPGTAGYAADKKADAAKVAAPKSATLAIPPASAVETQASPGPYNPRKQKADLWSSIREGSLAMLKAGESQ